MINILDNEKEILKNLEKLHSRNEFFKDKAEDYQLELLTEFALDIYNSDRDKFDEDKLKYILTQVDDEYSYYLLYKALKNDIELLNRTQALIGENRLAINEEYIKSKKINDQINEILRNYNLVKGENVFKSDGSVTLNKRNGHLLWDGRIYRVYLFSADESSDRIEFLYNNNIKREFKGKFIVKGKKVFYSDNLSELKKIGIDKIKIIEVN